VSSLVIRAFVAFAASTLSLQDDIPAGCAKSVRQHLFAVILVKLVSTVW